MFKALHGLASGYSFDVAIYLLWAREAEVEPASCSWAEAEDKGWWPCLYRQGSSTLEQLAWGDQAS